jgi:hypothetical protein
MDPVRTGVEGVRSSSELVDEEEEEPRSGTPTLEVR